MDLTEYVATFIQVGGIVVVFVIGFIRFRATTDAALVSIRTVTDELSAEVKKLGEAVTELRIEFAEARAERKGVNKRLARLEDKE